MSRTISAGYVYRQYSTEGVYIADYKSSRAAHEATGVSIGSIARAAHGERRTGGGYVWRKVLADSPKESIEIDLISKIGNHDKRPLVQKIWMEKSLGNSFPLPMPAGVLKSAGEAFHVRSAVPRKRQEATYGKRRWKMICRFRSSKASAL